MRCQRCQGHMVRNYFLDVRNANGEMDSDGWRCLNCGCITDSVIAYHRHASVHEPLKLKRRWSGHGPRFMYVTVKNSLDNSPLRPDAQ